MAQRFIQPRRFQQDDVVTVVRSPYLCIPRGTVVKLDSVAPDGDYSYPNAVVLGSMEYRFRESELTKQYEVAK